MECNKEEAVKAKEEAEKKMLNKEFGVARRLALRAQQLDPSLENLSQLLLVCNVHCFAEQRLFGNEPDWYGILQIEQTADEAKIKKQYRKLALQLHPDKNKFAGAEAAFKLIGEAQNLILDTTKRYYHDMKRRAAPSYCAPQNTCNKNAKKSQSNFSGVNHQHYHQSQEPPQTNSRPTFWTKCSFCFIRYQYHLELLGKTLSCQICMKAFVAVDIGQPVVPTSTHRSQPAHCQQKDVSNRAGHTAGVNFGGNASSKKSEAESFEKTVNGSRASSRKGTKKRRRMQVSESSEDDDSDNSFDGEYDVAIDDDGNLQTTTDFGTRRSTRPKQKVSYTDPLTDDDEVESSPKQAEV